MNLYCAEDEKQSNNILSICYDNPDPIIPKTKQYAWQIFETTLIIFVAGVWSFFFFRLTGVNDLPIWSFFAVAVGGTIGILIIFYWYRRYQLNKRGNYDRHCQF